MAALGQLSRNFSSYFQVIRNVRHVPLSLCGRSTNNKLTSNYIRVIHKRDFAKLDNLRNVLSNNPNSQTSSVSHSCHRIASIYRMMSSDRNSLSACWKCGKQVDAVQNMFFCECGIVQSPSESFNYFEVLGVETSFKQDSRQLTEIYRNLQRQLHPDRFSQKSEVSIV